jgi:multicomponent Na+:H+ antiporter subunit B
MTRRVRLVLFLVGAAGLGVVLVLGVTGLPSFGHVHSDYGDTLSAVTLNERHVPETIGAIVFDYRSIDSLEEEIILFAAAAAVAIVLRDEHDENVPPGAGLSASEVSDAVRVVALSLLPVAMVLGMYVVGHGHLSPGGGFQGGVVIAAAVTLLFVASDHRSFRRSLPDAALDPIEAAGMGGFLVVALIGFMVGAALLENVLPLGDPTRLASGGMIPLLSTTVGVEVTAGLLLVTTHYLDLLVQRAQRRTLRS